VTLTNLGPANQPPAAQAGGPYAIGEGQSLALDGSGSSDPNGDALSYSWDLNGDGVYGDATGSNPVLTWPQLQALGIDDGPSATVSNFAPTIDLAGDGRARSTRSRSAPSRIPAPTW
jgi:hypothetical protein